MSRDFAVDLLLMAACAVAAEDGCEPLVIKESTNPSSLSMRFCMSSGVVLEALPAPFFLLAAVA